MQDSTFNIFIIYTGVYFSFYWFFQEISNFDSEKINKINFRERPLRFEWK